MERLRLMVTEKEMSPGCLTLLVPALSGAWYFDRLDAGPQTQVRLVICVHNTTSCRGCGWWATTYHSTYLNAEIRVIKCPGFSTFLQGGRIT
jgi:hypothetical protein